MPLLAGCGGSSASRQLTMPELIAKADPICRPVIEGVDYAKLTQANIVRNASRLAALEERASAQLAKLTPPPSMADTWQLIVDGFRWSAEEFRKLGKTATANTSGGAFEPLYEAVRKRAWNAYEAGFKDCGTY
jgi:hypothetical protein